MTLICFRRDAFLVFFFTTDDEKILEIQNSRILWVFLTLLNLVSLTAYGLLEET